MLSKGREWSSLAICAILAGTTNQQKTKEIIDLET